MQLNIRKATLGDAHAMAELSRQLGYQSSSQAISNRLQLVLKTPDNAVYVAILGEEVVGWIHGFFAVRVESDPFVEIGGLVVNEYHRKKGIGKSLVEEVIQWSKPYGNVKLRVRCNVIRKESHRFYANLGFVEKKEQKVFEWGS